MLKGQYKSFGEIFAFLQKSLVPKAMVDDKTRPGIIVESKLILLSTFRSSELGLYNF